MAEDTTPVKGKNAGDQLSDVAIKELLRRAVPSAIKRLIELVDSKHPAVAMGACKVILGKVIPDLRATEFSGKDGTPLNVTFTVQSEEAKKELEKLYEGSNSTNSTGG